MATLIPDAPVMPITPTFTLGSVGGAPVLPVKLFANDPVFFYTGYGMVDPFPTSEHTSLVGNYRTNGASTLFARIGVQSTSQRIELGFKSTGTVALLVRVWVDGQPHATSMLSIPIPTSGNYYLLIDFLYQGTRTVILELQNLYVRSIGCESVGAFTTTPDVTKPKALAMGNSFTDAQSIVSRFDAWEFVAARKLGWNMWADGVGGSGYLVGLQPGQTYRDRIAADVYALDTHIGGFDKIIVSGGFNDANQTPTAMTTESGLLYDSIAANLPSAELIVILPFTNGTGTAQYTKLQGIRDDLRVSTLARSIPSIDPIGIPANPWIYGTGHVGNPKNDGNADTMINTDGTHPTVAGQALLGGNVAAGVAAFDCLIYPDGPLIYPDSPILYPWGICPPPDRTESGGPGGGGEWVARGKPDYPASRGGAWKRYERMDFKRPTRRQK